MTRRVLSASFVALLMLAMPALALEPLNTEKHINESLTAAKTADIIRNTCPTIKARMLVALSKGNDLKNYAESKGYKADEVKAFLKDKAEKARVKAAAEAWLAKAGAVAGDAESYCVVGRAEIAKGSLIGSLLKSTQ